MWSLTLKTKPTGEPFDLEFVKQHIRVDHDADDGLIEQLVTAVRRFCESTSNLAFLNQTWVQKMNCFPRGDSSIKLHRSPVASITSIKYLDSAGVQQTLNGSAYQLYSDSGAWKVKPAYNTYWPDYREQPDSIQIEFVAGYGTADDVPQELRQGMLLLIGHYYENREQTLPKTLSELPLSYRHLFASEHRHPF